MGGLGNKGDFMYKFVEESVIKPYRQSCSRDLTQLRDTLKENYEIITQFSLVGSGSDSRNMVTRNGDGPFDLDYNLQIISMPDKYWDDLRYLKETIRRSLNNIVEHDWFSDSSDSTSVLTAILHFQNSPQFEFSFDVSILAKNNQGNWCRLIHNKNAWGLGNDQYTWTEVPSSHNIKNKAKKLKDNRLWNKVRDTYIAKKNLYLSRRDNEHSSFTIFVESINEIYNKNFK